MDLSFSEEQHALRDLARQIFDGVCTDERLRALEHVPQRFDPQLWAECARAGLLGVGVPEADGGSGGGMIDLCVLLEEAGRATAPVPLWAALVTGAQPVCAFGSDEQRARFVQPLVAGGAPVVAALDEQTAVTVGGSALTGTAPLVPAGARASAVIVPVRGALYIVDARDCATIEPQFTPGAEPLAQITLAGARAEILAVPDAAAWLRERALVGLCAWLTGMCDRAVRMTAEYLGAREQFDKPLATFQAVQQRIADAFIDVELMRWTMWHAAWRLDAGIDATEDVAVAKYWASRGAARVLAAAQHLHGGVGVDMDYPLHRYTFLARQLELTMGGARHHLARLGELIAQ